MSKQVCDRRPVVPSYTAFSNNNHGNQQKRLQIYLKYCVFIIHISIYDITQDE